MNSFRQYEAGERILAVVSDFFFFCFPLHCIFHCIIIIGGCINCNIRLKLLKRALCIYCKKLIEPESINSLDLISLFALIII